MHGLLIDLTDNGLWGKQMNPEQRGIFPRIPFRKLVKAFEEPQEIEGFGEIVKVDFQVSDHSLKASDTATNPSWLSSAASNRVTVDWKRKRA